MISRFDVGLCQVTPVFLAVLSIFGPLYLGGCVEKGGRMRETPAVFYKGTDAYQKRVRALRLSEEEAREQLIRFLVVGTNTYEKWVEALGLSEEEAREQVFRFLAEEHKTVPVGDHHILVGDCYVFSSPDKLGIPLGGYYVNGNTGDVYLKESRGRIPFRKQ